MRIKADDVARLAGVSRSAVSRAFTPGASVAAETRARVLAAAAQLGYRPNLIARGLTGRRTGLIALVIGTIASPYETVLLDALSRGVRDSGYWPLLIRADAVDEMDRGLEEALSYQVDGVIVAAGSVSRDFAERCIASGAPLVLIGRIFDGLEVDSVCCDNAGAMRMLADRLVDRGRRRIAWVGGRADTFSNVERRDGLRQALADRGLEPVAERRGDYSVESGLVQGLALLTDSDPPDAIACGNDAMALGVLDAARRLGCTVPDSVSVTGFDDIPAAAWEAYQLSTVRNPVEETMRTAVELLRRRIADPTAPARLVRLPGALVMRRTI